MNPGRKITIAAMHDLERWLALCDRVKGEFHGIDLRNDESYRNAVVKNIERGSAVFVAEGERIIGAMIYSTRSKHIGWIAVDPEYRRQGIGAALVAYFFDRFGDTEVLTVKTFLKSDVSGPRAHGFYESMGFIAEETEEDRENLNAGHPFQVFRNYRRR